jgi:predicted alpha/beta hydrolase
VDPSSRVNPAATVRATGPTESMDVRTTDGWSLRVDVHEQGESAIGVALLGHALMARRTEFDRPVGAGLASFLIDRGWHVVAFDFRGHGDSGPAPREGGTFGYDALVTRDLPAVCEFARSEVGRGLPVVVVGHSLGGHAALAAQGTRAMQVDAIATLASTMWMWQLDLSHRRWWAKRATVETMLVVARRVGYFPARALRLGSDDEPRALIEDITRVVRSGTWTSADGGVDYLSSLSQVRVPVMQILSENDRFECDPESGARFAERCPNSTIVRIARGDDETGAPTHMGLVTSGRVRGVWSQVEAWMRKAVTL